MKDSKALLKQFFTERALRLNSSLAIITFLLYDLSQRDPDAKAMAYISFFLLGSTARFEFPDSEYNSLKRFLERIYFWLMLPIAIVLMFGLVGSILLYIYMKVAL